MMALNGQAYAFDLDALRAAFGSKDETLRASIKVLNEVSHDEDEVPPAFTPEQALADVIDGEFRAPEGSEYLYGYAIEDLCYHFGEVIPIPPDGDGYVDIEIGDPEDLEIRSPLLDGALPIEVPRWDDAPYVRFLDVEATAREAYRLAQEDLSHEEPSIEEGRRILLYQLRWAADRRRAFVTVANG